LSALPQRLTCLTSARFRARAPGPVSGQLSTRPGGGAGNNSAGFLLPFGRRPSLLEASCPARGLSPSYDRPTAPPQAARTRAGFPCSARMSYGWIGCLLDPGGSGARATGCASPGRRLPLFNGPPLSPWITTRPRMSDSRGISEGSLSFTPASLPLACGPRRNGTLGLFPELRTRQDTTLPRTSGRGRATGHCPDHVPGISQPPSTYSLTPCDNASQGTQRAGVAPGVCLLPGPIRFRSLSSGLLHTVTRIEDRRIMSPIAPTLPAAPLTCVSS
jgi:hypothetical protein